MIACKFSTDTKENLFEEKVYCEECRKNGKKSNEDITSFFSASPTGDSISQINEL